MSDKKSMSETAKGLVQDAADSVNNVYGAINRSFTPHIDLKEHFAGSLYFEILSLSTKKKWKFEAFLTGYSDDYESSWNRETVYGRQDPISTFINTSRTISIDFDLTSENAWQGVRNWEKINEFAQATYPIYEKVNGESILSSPPLFGLKFKNLVRELENGLGNFLYGTFDGVNITPNLDEGVYVVGNTYFSKRLQKKVRTFRGNAEETFIIPRSYTVSLKFHVIHTDFRGNEPQRPRMRGGPTIRQSDQRLREKGVSQKRIDKLNYNMNGRSRR